MARYRWWMGLLGLSFAAGSACGGGGTGGSTSSSSGAGGEGGVMCGPDGPFPDEVLPDATDPEQGMFTLEEALAELPEGPGPLRAVIDTDLGVLTCSLYANEAPNAVANFIGLARGRRPWKDPVSKKWVKKPFYNGLTFHRVIPNFVAQGGDPLGTGKGGPGYKFADEIAGLHHSPGTLAYANSGANTNGSQFYIAEIDLPTLDANYTIFGLCDPLDVVVALTHVATDDNDKPLAPLHMKTVTITRCAP